MKGHPGGMEHTGHMLSLSGLIPPAKILDMGAGKGEAVQYLLSLGYQPLGIDLSAPDRLSLIDNRGHGTQVLRGDFLNPPFEKDFFDGILSQCAFYVSGLPAKAFSIAYDLLKSGGILMLSDVCPRNTTLQAMAEASGFTVLHFEDQTPAWKKYYIEAIWRGTEDCFPCNQKMNYEMIICKK